MDIKLMPEALALEKGVLCSILNWGYYEDCASIINADSFFDSNNKRIFEACKSLFNEHKPIDVLTVTNKLKQLGQLDIIGGNHYLAEITSIVDNGVNSEYHCRIIQQKYLMRKIIELSTTYINEAYNDSIDVFDLITKIQLEISNLEKSISIKSITTLGEIALDVIEEMEINSKRGNDFLGLPCGIKKIDSLTGGFCAPDLICVAAQTGEGKSTFVLQTAKYNVLNDIPVLLFSLEMKSKQLMWKLFSSEIESELINIRRGNLHDDQWKKLKSEVYDKYKNAPLYIHDTGGLSIFDLMSISKSYVREKCVKMIIVDYLGLLNARGAEQKFGTKEQEVSYISKQLKSLAMQLNVPIIEVSQMSRMERGTKRLYQNSDLRDSGAVEQDADGIIFIYSPSLHEVERLHADDDAFEHDDVLFLLTKWRLGETGKVFAKFEGNYNRFKDHPKNEYYVPEYIKDKF